MPSAEIITIGTELLLGEIIDTNSSYIARELRNNGVDVYRTTSVGDNITRIAEIVREAVQRADIVITTGGLGPTVDDPTRDAIALAFETETEFREELWAQINARYARFGRTPTENNRRQAFIPKNALPLENPVGTAPCFLIKTTRGAMISLPGVPREMEHMLENEVLPYLRANFVLEHVLKVRILKTAWVGESQIDDKIGDLETLTNPTVGLAAHSGQVDIRLTAKAKNEREADKLIREVEAEIRDRIGEWIFGADGDTLESVTMQHLYARGWSFCAVEAGLEGKLLRRFAQPHHKTPFVEGKVLPHPPRDPDDLQTLTAAMRNQSGTEVGLGVALYTTPQTFVQLTIITPETEKSLRAPYGGPPKLAHRRAINLGLDALRKYT